jgi:hypothetical protein
MELITLMLYTTETTSDEAREKHRYIDTPLLMSLGKNICPSTQLQQSL